MYIHLIIIHLLKRIYKTMPKNKITYSKIVECEDQDILHFIEINQPKDCKFEKSEKLEELTEDESKYLTEVLRSRFDSIEAKFYFKDSARMIVSIVEKLGLDDDCMINDFKDIFK